MNKKFRAYYKEKEEILEVEAINFKMQEVTAKDGIWIEDLYHNEMVKINIFDFDDVELIQYTGLKDKNGKEIYEGDIVKYQKNKLFGGGEIRKGLFVYDEWRAGFHIEDKNGYWNPEYTWNGSQLENEGSSLIEVIGNKFENPELLNN